MDYFDPFFEKIAYYSWLREPDYCDNYVKRWEDGFNRKFDILKLKALFDSYPGNYTSIHLNDIEGINIDYDFIDNSLTMICFWNIK